MMTMGNCHSRRGFILISVLALVMVLGIFIWSMGRLASTQINQMERAIGKTQSYAAARAGFYYVIDKLALYPTAQDSLYNVGVDTIKDNGPAQAWEHIKVSPDCYARVGFKPTGYARDDLSIVDGIQDESSKININAINGANVSVLSSLFQLKGLSRQEADTLSMRIVTYQSSADMPGMGEGAFHLEDQAQGTRPKQRPFEHLEELLEVAGMTRELYDKIKDDVTVYGQAQNGLNINLYTVKNDVLRALFNAIKQENPAANVDALYLQSVAFRDGNDGISFTPDDGTGSVPVPVGDWPAALRPQKSTLLRVRVTGVDQVHRVSSTITAIIDRSMGMGLNQIIDWQRD